MRNITAQPDSATVQRPTVMGKAWMEEDMPSIQAERLTDGIGSSEAAAVMGLDVQCSPLDLWHKKMGLLTQPQVPPEKDDCKVSWEFILEPLVAAVYSKRTGHRIRRVQKTLQHPQCPWMGAAIRWEVASSYVRHLHCVQVPEHELSGWKTGVPEAVRVDAMHLLAVTGGQAVDIAALIGGRTVQIFRIERDEKLIERLTQAESVFWGYVERRQPPLGN
ncbi:MAG: YqaJ viral recombinase family protein [Pseudomonadota bacterium]